MSENTYAPGMRVVAIRNTDADSIYIYGWGVYEGKFLPPWVNLDEEVAAYRAEYEKAKAEDPDLPEQFDEVQFRATLEQILGNPRIKLDSGQTVWGYECWWAPATKEETEEKTDRKIVMVDIDTDRRMTVN
jgi:hypothetical protein